METIITSRGRVTIPKLVRERLNLKPGDRVKFFVHLDRGAVLLPVLPVSALRGMITPPKRHVTVEDMTEAAAAGAAESARPAAGEGGERNEPGEGSR